MNGTCVAKESIVWSHLVFSSPEDFERIYSYHRAEHSMENGTVVNFSSYGSSKIFSFLPLGVAL